MQHKEWPGTCPGGPALRFNRLSLMVLVALGYVPWVAQAAPGPEPGGAPEPASAQFDPSFFGASGAGAVDVSRFERGNPVTPGSYRVDLYVNEIWLGREQITIRPGSGGTEQGQVCVTQDLLQRMGVDLQRLGETAPDALTQECVDLANAIPSATVSYDSAELRLDVSIPQLAMNRHARGYVDPKYWDAGITAATLNYNVNATHSNMELGGSATQAYAGLNFGLNLGRWRFRNQSSYRWSEHSSDWQNLASYAQTDIAPWKSQLTLGDGFTSGELFDSFGYRGARIASDDRMLPDSMVGYAPTVRGTADTNARVEIRQGGYVIYEMTVAPGAFEINDLYATGYGGDLEVTVIESDGRTRTFSVPYAAVPQLLRPGVSRFSGAVGQVRDTSLTGSAPIAAEGTYQRGINNSVTLYGGGQLTEGGKYAAAIAGAAFNTPVGAVSTDVTYSSTKLSRIDRTQDGYSARVTYSKSIPQTNTDFALAAYRYSSQGYLGLGDAVRINDLLDNGTLVGYTKGDGTQRNRLQLTVSQRLGPRAGSLYLSGSRNDYWSDTRVDATYQLGYTNQYRGLSYGITAGRTRDLLGRYDNQYYVTMSVPLGRDNDNHTPTLTASGGRNGRDTTGRFGVNGIAGENDQVNYDVSLDTQGWDRATVAANAQYRSPYASTGASYTYGDKYQSASLSASGGIVAHRGGVDFAQSLGETIGVVEADGATGAHVATGANTRIGRSGRAIVTSLTPYRMNTVDIDPKGMSMDVELETTSQRVAPTAGAVVALSYPTVSGQAMLITGRQADGSFLPFGAQVIDEHGIEIGTVGQAGRIFARGVPDSGALLVKWGDGGDQECRLSYHKSTGSEASGGMSRGEAQCAASQVRSVSSVSAAIAPWRKQ